MKEWTGIVEEISSKDWNGIRLWSFRIEGESRWFRTQKTALDVPLGTNITFTERNSQVDLSSVSVTTSAPAESTLPTPAPSAVSTSGDMDVGTRIQWQAARRDASQIMAAALMSDNMPWAANLAKGKRLDMLLGYINELTKQFVEEENG